MQEIVDPKTMGELLMLVMILVIILLGQEKKLHLVLKTWKKAKEWWAKIQAGA